MFLYLIVKIHNMKYVEKLSLILMKSLYLNIEYRTRVYVNTVVLLYRVLVALPNTAA